MRGLRKLIMKETYPITISKTKAALPKGKRLFCWDIKELRAFIRRKKFYVLAEIFVFVISSFVAVDKAL